MKPETQVPQDETEEDESTGEEAAEEQQWTRKLFESPHLTPPKSKEVIVWHSVWFPPSHFRWSCVTQAECELLNEAQAKCLQNVLAVEHCECGCRAEEDREDSDRSGWQRHWSTNSEECQHRDCGTLRLRA